MGHMGLNSHISDHAWDFMGATTDDIHHMTQPEVDALCQRAFHGLDLLHLRNKELALGVVIAALEQRLAVPDEHLFLAVQCARALQESAEYLGGWRNRQGRIQALTAEIQVIEAVLKGEPLDEEHFAEVLYAADEQDARTFPGESLNHP